MMRRSRHFRQAWHRVSSAPGLMRTVTPDRETMGNHRGEQKGDRGRLVWVAGFLATAGATVAIAAGTGVLRTSESGHTGPTPEQSAQQRCESDVMKRVVSPDKATISDVNTETSSLDPDGRDFSSLTASEPLKGVDTSRITVLNVAGVANVPSEVGTTIQDRFDCRAYFVDGTLAHTLVVFDHGH